ncbi:MAG: hypothetical protein EOO75_06655 [Myxococcales bacterium]|nr:MAG: hypothetical protein EOO75_06655 [Myxococcales bacterium]
MSGGMWWVEARVRLDERGAIEQGQGRARRPVVDVAGRRPREQVAEGEWAALWLLALLEAQSELAIDTAQQWDWSCAASAGASPGTEAPYRATPGDQVTWHHTGGRPQAVVSRLDGLSAVYGLTGFQVEANVRLLPLAPDCPLELGLLVEQMLASTDPPLVDLLARCRAFLATEPDSMQRRTGTLATLAQR